MLLASVGKVQNGMQDCGRSCDAGRRERLLGPFPVEHGRQSAQVLDRCPYTFDAVQCAERGAKYLLFALVGLGVGQDSGIAERV